MLYLLFIVDHFNPQVLSDAYACLSVTVFVTIPVKSMILFCSPSMHIIHIYSDIIEIIYKTCLFHKPNVESYFLF